MDKLRKVVIKEEYIAITGEMLEAILLNQMIYWSEKVQDFDKFISEENERVQKYKEKRESIQELNNGWIYKKASELKEELMDIASEKTISRKLDNLVEKGYLDRRRNPKYKYDRTYQYRVNFINLVKDLFEKGYTLQNYKIDINFYYEALKVSKGQNDDSNTPSDISQSQNDDLKSHGDDSHRHSDGAIPKITTKSFCSSSNKEFSEIKKVFDQNIHPITPIEAQKLIAYLDDDGMDYRLIIRAIEIAVCNSKRYLAYIEGILKRWRENNLLTLEAVEAYMRDYQNKQSQGRDKQFDTVKSKNQEVKSSERNRYTGTTKTSTSTDKKHREYKPKPPETYGLEQLSEEELKEWMRENGIF
ncbi:DnaD domain-containing protein [Tepidibacter hydrothermalis]|uniref:DnaD domain protein n=1 Tax=Tepidibacter hydrothermalis TaxID=3036126 RepID=A0ABY8E7B1_9FIRM|nr:DnaD domain protein [Tepidibacter hydrothermalis]WFD08739.1 DnaD domain protein [Tepidibacter hydrothermalis]